MSECHARAYLNAMRLLDVVDDGGTLPLLDGVADGIVNSVTLLAFDCITDLFSLDTIGRPALFLVVDLAFLREVGVDFEGKLKGCCIWVPRLLGSDAQIARTQKRETPKMLFPSYFCQSLFSSFSFVYLSVFCATLLFVFGGTLLFLGGGELRGALVLVDGVASLD